MVDRIPDLLTTTSSTQYQVYWLPADSSVPAFLYPRLWPGSARGPLADRLARGRIFLHRIGRPQSADVPVFGYGVAPQVSFAPEDVATRVYAAPGSRWLIGSVFATFGATLATTAYHDLRQMRDVGVDQVIFIQQAGRNAHADICSSLELFASDVMPEFAADEADRQQRERLARVKATRDNAVVAECLEALRVAARGTENVVPRILDCARAYCTLYEIRAALESEFGAYREPVFF
jgi:hypothetical protein